MRSDDTHSGNGRTFMVARWVPALLDAVDSDIISGQVQKYRPKAAFRRLLEASLGGVNFGDPDGSPDPTCHILGGTGRCCRARRYPQPLHAA